MLDISFSELLLCFVVALVVLGPERLPGIARGIGRWTGRARSYMRQLSAELDRESSVAEFRRQIGDAKRIIETESATMKSSFDDAARAGREAVEGRITPPQSVDAGEGPAAAAPLAAAAPPAPPAPGAAPVVTPPPAATAPVRKPLHDDPYV